MRVMRPWSANGRPDRVTATGYGGHMTSRERRRRPGRFQKLLLDLPVRLYEAGLGGLFGSRLVVLVHRGRRSGHRHRTVLEVLEHRPVDGEYRVISGWGRDSDWYRNLRHSPAGELWVGRRRWEVDVRELSPGDAADAMRAHLLAHPTVTSRINSELWEALRQGEEAFRSAMAAFPVIGLRPIGEIAWQPEWWKWIGRKVAPVLTSTGFAPRTVTLETVGRASGLPRRVSVTPVQLGAGMYLVALGGEAADWVANAQAAGGAAGIIAGRRRDVRLHEVPVGERSPILHAWVTRRAFTHSPRSSARVFFGFDHVPSQAELARVADRYPVFRVEEL